MTALRATVAAMLLVGTAAMASAPSAMTRYTIKGDRTVFPTVLGDDGAKTYLQWDADRDLPAVFGSDPKGHEVLADGYMRGDYYVIDRVYPRLVFRLDKAVAVATRAPSDAR